MRNWFLRNGLLLAWIVLLAFAIFLGSVGKAEASEVTRAEVETTPEWILFTNRTRVEVPFDSMEKCKNSIAIKVANARSNPRAVAILSKSGTAARIVYAKEQRTVVYHCQK